MWKATKGSPPKSALIFMSNDAVGLVVQKQLPEHAKTLNLDVPFSQSFQMGLSRSVGRGGAGAALQARPDLPRRLHQRHHPDHQGAARRRRRRRRSSAPVPPGYDSVGKGLGAAADRFFAPMIWNWDLNVPGNKEFVAAYKAAYPTQPYPPANEHARRTATSMGLIIGQALEKAASRDPQEDPRRSRDDRVHEPAVPGDQGEIRRQRPQCLQPELLAEWIKGEIRTVWPKEIQAVQPVL